MPTTQTAKNMPKGGANEHSRPTSSTSSSGKQRAPSHRELHTEAYEYDGNSNKVPPAGEYLRAPVCCSECEEFWKALILEVDEKHTSRVAAGKASLIMSKGGSGSVLQIKSTKHVTKKRNQFLPGELGCKNVTVRGDAFHSCQSAAARQISSNPTSIKRGYYRGPESPQKKLSYHKTPTYSSPSPFANKSGLPRQYELQGSLHTRYNAYGAVPKYDVVSTPRRHSHSHSHGHGHIPKSVYPESRPSFTQTRRNHLSSEANQVHRPETISSKQDFKPIRTSVDKRSEESLSHLSTPRRYIPIYSESFRNSHGLQHTDSSPSRPFTPTTTRFSEKANSQEDFSNLTTPRVYSPLPRASVSQEKHLEDFLHYDYPATTPQTPSSRWGTQKYKEQLSTSAGGKASRTQREPSKSYAIDKASPKYPLKQEDYLQSGHENASPNSGHTSNGERNLSRTSTIESGYTTLSIPRSDSSSNSLDGDLDGSKSKRDTKALGAQDLGFRDLGRPSFNIPPRNNLSRTSTGTSSLMEPIMLFTGHDCRSETDEDDDITNPSYFKHIITNPYYMKHIVKPLRPPPPPPGLAKKDLAM